MLPWDGELESVILGWSMTDDTLLSTGRHQAMRVAQPDIGISITIFCTPVLQLFDVRLSTHDRWTN
jgi:hypothetical protein